MKFTYSPKRFLLWFVLFCLCIVGSVSALASEVTVDLANMSIDQFAAHLDTAVPDVLKASKVEGMAIAVVRNGEIAFSRGYGWQDKSAKLPVETDTVFQMASISKSLAAWGVMKLVQEGKIDLDTPVETYLTRWKLPNSKFDHTGVTVRRLLSHTAGMSLSGYPGLSPKKPLPTIEESLNGKTGGAGRVYVKYEPGAQYIYSGGGYTLLQLLIEEVSGQRFEDYMAEQVLKPLGMTSSSYSWDEALRPRTAKGYDTWGHALPNYLFTAKAAAGLYSTAPDMAKWLVSTIRIYNGIETGILQRDTLQLMFQPVKQGYGLGHFSFAAPSGEQMVWHSGANAGWRSIYVILPGLKDGVVILTNNERGAKAMYEVLNQWFAWEHVQQRFVYGESFMTKMMYFYNVLRNIVE